MYLCVRGHVFVCEWTCICVWGVMYLCMRGHVFVCKWSCICVWGVMYVCVRGINFASFYDFNIRFVIEKRNSRHKYRLCNTDTRWGNTCWIYDTIYLISVLEIFAIVLWLSMSLKNIHINSAIWSNLFILNYIK